MSRPGWSKPIHRLWKFVPPAVILCWSLGYLLATTRSGSGTGSYGYGFGYGDFLRQFGSERKVFVADFLAHEIDGPFDGRPIADFCSSRLWTPGLVLSCDPPSGGIGKVKNAHLHCIRIAMEMGGMG